MAKAEEILEKIDGRLDAIPPCIIRGHASISENQFQTIGEIGEFWNFDKRNGEWFFNHFEEYTEKCDQEIVEYGPRSKKTGEPLICEKLQEDIRTKMIRLDKEIINHDISKLTFDDLEPYLILLTEHQHLRWNHMINRWGLVPIAKDLRSAKKLEGCEKTGKQIEVFLEKPFGLEINFHTVMSGAWDAVQSGFPDLTLKVLEPLYRFYTSNEMKIMEGVYIEHPLVNVLRDSKKRNIKELIDPGYWARYKMSNMICLAKAYSMLGKIEKAKDLYAELISSHLKQEVTLGEGNEKRVLSPLVGGRDKPKVNYWIGKNRILETAIEFHNLETNTKIKKGLKDIIFTLFKENRKIGRCNESTDSTREPLLVVYMMLKHVYGYLK